jgi:ParB family chromosome partitioning protein
MKLREGNLVSRYDIHPLAELFPRMSGDEYAALKEDIKTHGLLEPIWLYQGKVLDGRHRYLACLDVGVEPRFRQYEGGDPVGFVVSLNLKRRHLNESQRAMVAASLANLETGRPSANAQICAVSQGDAAHMLQVSRRSVQAAAKVEREAPAPVVEAVKAGRLSLNLAAQVAELPDEEQEVVAAAEPEQMREVAREVIHNHRAQGTGENEWYTPQEYVDAARKVMGAIDLDPASSELAQQTIKAGSFYSMDDDGLRHEWSGRVWLNPPYSQPAIHEFMQKAVDEFKAGNMTECIALTHNYTDTKWFHLAAEHAAAICFTRGRIAFVSPDGKKAAPTQGQAFFYFGGRIDAFAAEFSRFGFVMVKP